MATDVLLEIPVADRSIRWVCVQCFAVPAAPYPVFSLPSQRGEGDLHYLRITPEGNPYPVTAVDGRRLTCATESSCKGSTLGCFDVSLYPFSQRM